MRFPVQDPNAEHEIRIRALGNSMVFVTCKCMDSTRRRWKGRTRGSGRRAVEPAPEWKSLGDFPNDGGPIEPLLAAFQRHLDDVAAAER